MNVALTPDDPGFIDLHQLRLEHCWLDVRKALTKILVGHLLIILGAAASGALVVLFVWSLQQKDQPKAINLAFEAVCWLALGLLALCSLWGYGKILLGQWMCLKYAPERCGARWVMFACITCMLMGPTFNTISTIGGVKQPPEIRRGPREFRLPKIDPSVRNMQISATAVSLISYVLFMIFLRSVARCFGDTGRATHVMVFLFVQAVLFLTTLYVAYDMITELKMRFDPEFLIAIGLGWLISGLWYLYLIFSIRMCISEGMELMRSPLDYSSFAAEQYN
jgi:hypothetical protein